MNFHNTLSLASDISVKGEPNPSCIMKQGIGASM